MLKNSVKVTNKLQPKKLANELSVLKGSANNTTTALGYSKMYACWVPWSLTEHHKSVQKEVCLDLFSQNRADGKSFLSQIITGDKTQIHHFEPQIKRQLMEWHHPTSPQKKTVRATTSAEKSWPNIFWEEEGVILAYIMSCGQTINSNVYIWTLKTLQKLSRRVKPHKYVAEILLQHDKHNF